MDSVVSWVLPYFFGVTSLVRESTGQDVSWRETPNGTTSYLRPSLFQVVNLRPLDLNS